MKYENVVVAEDGAYPVHALFSTNNERLKFFTWNGENEPNLRVMVWDGNMPDLSLNKNFHGVPYARGDMRWDMWEFCDNGNLVLCLLNQEQFAEIGDKALHNMWLRNQDGSLSHYCVVRKNYLEGLFDDYGGIS